jgi:predicted TIM-barrel fold metal-dependent hydrolase
MESMPIIDVDSHYEPLQPGSNDDANPLREFLKYFPPLETLALHGLAGDLWQETSEEVRALLANDVPMVRMLRGDLSPSSSEMMMALSAQPAGATDVDARLEWMDHVGIEFSLVNPGGYSALALPTSPFVDDSDIRHAMIRQCNDFLADWIGEHTTRLSPVSLVDTDDICWSVTEMERMRSRGSRAVFLPATPFGGMSPAHTQNDQFWHTVEHLGMVGIVHIGSTPAYFAGGWADADWREPGAGGVGGFLRFANSARIESAQKFISALVFGGVFERCPNVTIIFEELWAGWLPWFVSRFEQLSDPSGRLGSFDLPLHPQEYLRKNLKLTPLPGLGDDGMSAISEVADMLVFSSDFPHIEGNVDPVAAYGGKLESLPVGVRERFLGRTMEECFARTGDPLPLANSVQ